MNIAAAAAAAAAAAVAASSSSVGAVPSNDLDRDDDSEEGAPIAASSSRSAPVDADDHSESGEAANSSSDSDDDSDDDDDDDSHDETAELMRELARIKQEREAERIKLEQEKLMRDARDNEDAVLRSNPLLNSDSDARGGDLASDSVLKRKWFEETAFKNQAKVEDPKKAKRFINDTVRSDFHVRFLERYVK